MNKLDTDKCRHGLSVENPCWQCDEERGLPSIKCCDDLRETFTRNMAARGLATGHGDTLADLHRELWRQFDEIRTRNRTDHE